MAVVHRLILGLCLAASALGAAAQRSEAMSAPLRSKNAKQPIFVLADQVWTQEEIRIQPREFTGTAKELPRSSHKLKVGSFRYDGVDGPVTLVVDYAAYLVDPSADAEAAVFIDIECPKRAQGCAYPMHMGVLPFRKAFMASQEVATEAGKRTILVGRESHSYTFPRDTMVDMYVRLQEPVNLEPLELKARLIFGEHDARALPGQMTRQGLVWRIVGGAIVVLIAAYWWLRRSRY